MKKLLVLAVLLLTPVLASAQGFDLNPQVVAAYAYSTSADQNTSRFALTANLPGVRLGDEGFWSKLYIGGVGIDIRTVPGYEDLPADYLGWSVPLVTVYPTDTNFLIQVGYMQDIGQQGDKHLYGGVGFSVVTAKRLAQKRAEKKLAKEQQHQQRLASMASAQ